MKVDKPSIRSFPRNELDEMLLRPPPVSPLLRLFTNDEIRAEKARRDEIAWKRQDTVRYPELQQGFH
jgi:hypothetical protein